MLQNKKIAMLVAFKDFRDEELFIPRDIFLQKGAKVTVVSTKKGKAIGTYGGVIDVDLTLEDLQISEFDAIVFVGGAGASKYIGDETCWQLAKDTISQGKVLAAICIAPATLSRSGVLQGKKATVWSSSMDKSAVKILEEGGATYVAKPVVVDSNIVTAWGPQAARKFATEIVNLLQNI